MNDDHLVLCFKGHGEESGHKCLHTEKASFYYCDEDVCLHCCHIEKESNKLLNGFSGHYGKNIDVMIKEINDKSYGGG